ncbi:MAG: 30S ribosomal protein S6 [Planctomycetaceae bacterium]|nr:30S ribosomal protein S6 [Planctomycetaceae bacterium]
MSKLYEAMFIVDSAKAKEDYAKMKAECLGCLTRHGAEIVKAVKWDDRRLTYEMKKIRRGTFILVHFNSDPANIGKMERQCQLNENVLRVLILVDEDGIEVASSREEAKPETAESAAE